jgi:DNA-binding transcriptional LysR family regulator
MSMNLFQLNVFREVMKTGSMSEAASNLGRTQPAVSLSLKSLENSLGIVLFNRDTRNLKPVPEAYYLLSEADRVLTQMAQLERTMHRLQAGEEGELHLATMPGVSTALFPNFLSGFMADRPDVKLSLHTRSSTQLRELVSSQGVDMGFGDYEEDHSRTQQTRVTLISGNCFLAIPASHPMSEQTVIPLAAMSGLVFGAMQVEHAFQRRLKAEFDAAGLNLVVQIRSQIVLPLLQFVAAGQCFAVVDPLTVASADLSGISQDSVVFRPIEKPIRYEYAAMVPQMRPLSALSIQLVEAWEVYVLDILDKLQADPKLERLS